MQPEEKARVEIDRQLEKCGWIVQDYAKMNISAGPVAVREFPLTTGFADYFLYVNGKAIGVVEAKPEGHTLTGVETQSAKYTEGLPPGLPTHHNPLPFAYESTGKITQFTNALEPDARSRPVFTFHQPDELLRLVNLPVQVRKGLRELPPLVTEGLRKVQVTAIQNLEKSLALNRPRALVQMATGTGKTFTAVTLLYRLIKFAGAHRILFLVDRNNLGRQAANEFKQYISPHSGYKFTDEFNVQHLHSNTIDDVSRVCITTVQRLYSMLKGEPEFEEENEEGSLFETASPLVKEPLPVVYNERIPIETFDFIIIDECHRSIYNLWRQVLEYFDATLIGLTATPTKQTIGFFNNNLVMEYGHEQACADGVNVGFDVYRIRTRISQDGSTLEAESGRFIPRRDKRTKVQRLAELEDDLTYTANDLDRDVVAPDQIRLVCRTFRDKLFTEIFPGRTEVPKTLVFAKDDSHADDITRIMREEFGKGIDFCQKITYKTTGKKPEDLLAEFRNSYNPRIAVSVDMIATGTDVKALECLLFMRNVKSAGYFEQMKGRGVRTVDSDTLQSVTPDSKHKTHFVIVDAVGVCEQDKTTSKPLDRKPSVSLEKLMKMVATGMAAPDLVSTLAARLTRLDRQLTADQQEEIAEAAGGTDLKELTATLLASIDPDNVEQRAEEQSGPEPTEDQTTKAEQELMTEALKPFHNPRLRELVLNIQKSHEQVIDEVSQDELIAAGFDAQALEKARALVTDFRQFIEDNREELEALRLLYSVPYRSGLRFKHVKELAAALERPPLSAPLTRLWQAFEAVEPERVKGHGGNKLVDVIALVRHAIDPAKPLEPFPMTVEERYRAWLAEQEQKGVSFTLEQRKWLDAIRDHIASSLSIDQDDFDYAPFNVMGGLGEADALFGDRLSSILEELNERLAA
ncbi:MAG: DEAD/DEAH box helicase family protein [Pirellulales bacterium]|nr:DEAD/DEAH box helicase family protein [Pirellulales bacterium]